MLDLKDPNLDFKKLKIFGKPYSVVEWVKFVETLEKFQVYYKTRKNSRITYVTVCDQNGFLSKEQNLVEVYLKD